MLYNKDLPIYMTHNFGFITPQFVYLYKLTKIDGEIYFYAIDVIKEVLDEDLDLYDFYVTNFDHFKSNIFNILLKAGYETKNDRRLRFSSITKCKRAIYHPKKTDENWEDIEFEDI